MMTDKKPNLVLLPGLLNDARLWQHQISALSPVANASVADLTTADSISQLAFNVLSTISSERFALAGLSMGGYVALEIMRQAPGRVIALALIDTSARPDTPEATEGRKKMMHVSETDFQSVIDTLMPKLVHPSRLDDASIVDEIDAMAHSVGQQAFIRQQTAIMNRIDSRPYLAGIKCPTLVLCGRQDVITPLAVHEELVAGIPGSKLVIVDDCGHLSTLGQPQQVSDAMKMWLQ